MPRYIVQRTFSGGLNIPPTEDGAAACLGVVERNGDLGVTRVRVLDPYFYQGGAA